jgi:protein pelota
MGQYHTVEIELAKDLSIGKDSWDSIFMDRLQEASNPGAHADVAAVVMHEGLCHVCLLSKSMTVTKARIERRIPKKSRQARCQ